jgi:hypothetical protein
MAEYAFSKAPIPRGMSFPLKRSVLDAALDAAGIERVATVYYALAQRGARIVVWSQYLGEAHRGFAAAGTSSVTLYAVPSTERHRIEEALVDVVLPQLVKWLRDIEASGSGRRAMTRDFAAEWVEGRFDVRSN